MIFTDCAWSWSQMVLCFNAVVFMYENTHVRSIILYIHKLLGLVLSPPQVEPHSKCRTQYITFCATDNFYNFWCSDVLHNFCIIVVFHNKQLWYWIVYILIFNVARSTRDASSSLSTWLPLQIKTYLTVLHWYSHIFIEIYYQTPFPTHRCLWGIWATRCMGWRVWVTQCIGWRAWALGAWVDGSA